MLTSAGTVEAGAGAGEGVKRKRSDDMAALEADLAPEPQAGESRPYCKSLPAVAQAVRGSPAVHTDDSLYLLQAGMPGCL